MILIIFDVIHFNVSRISVSILDAKLEGATITHVETNEKAPRIPCPPHSKAQWPDTTSKYTGTHVQGGTLE